MPDGKSVSTNTEHKTAVELRAEKIASYSTVLRALGAKIRAAVGAEKLACFRDLNSRDYGDKYFCQKA